MLEIRIIRKKYIPTDEMVSAGELEYQDITDYTETITLSEFIDFLNCNGYGVWESSRFPLTLVDNNTWLTSHGVTNYRTYEHEELSLHCADKKTSRWTRYLKAAQSKGLI